MTSCCPGRPRCMATGLLPCSTWQMRRDGCRLDGGCRLPRAGRRPGVVLPGERVRRGGSAGGGGQGRMRAVPGAAAVSRLGAASGRTRRYLGRHHTGGTPFGTRPHASAARHELPGNRAGPRSARLGQRHGLSLPAEPLSGRRCCPARALVGAGVCRCRCAPVRASVGRNQATSPTQPRLPDGILVRAKAVASAPPSRWGHASATVDGMRSCRAAWSARHPVKVEVAGSNPVRTAGYVGVEPPGIQPGQVAQSV
jgi:hypothetical protein